MSLLWVKHKQTNEILLVVKNDSTTISDMEIED